ncbi:helix-turn-helix transcriptional regulator [uncultured Capnocytophaga sp.]|uniref:helix-turn-helix domain-containing protein n=1 Tax=uncultured Capnocytophaga sp. TaxID=159273 RepID=UPI00288A41C1|nr:helix-turn-helix transcriptional regulator [uncultured Capnocytophaga sp.]
MEKLEIFKQVGKNIQQIRQSKGLSQVDLVGCIEGNIDTTNISRIEQGRTNPTLLTLYRIAQALEVPLTDLVKDSTTKVAEK